MNITNTKKKKKLIYYITGATTLGVIATSTFVGLTISQSKSPNKSADPRIALLHKVLKGNNPLARSFGQAMSASTAVVNESKIRNANASGLSTTKLLKDNYVRSFKVILKKWISANVASLVTVGLNADEKTIMSWFDFNNAGIDKDISTPEWQYEEKNQAGAITQKKIEAYTKYDITIPLKESSDKWKFKIITYKDPSDAELDKALKYMVDKEQYIGQIIQSSSTHAINSKTFGKVLDAATKSMPNNIIGDQSTFDSEILNLSKELALQVISRQVNTFKELASLRVNYTKMQVVRDLQKLNIDLAQYNNNLEMDSSSATGFKMAANNTDYVLANPTNSTIVKAIHKTLSNLGMAHFKEWLKGQAGYEMINQKEAYLIDVSAYIDTTTSKSVKVLDYLYEINGETSTKQHTQSWIKSTDISFHLLRPAKAIQKDILKKILAQYRAVTQLSQSRDDYTNVVKMVNLIKTWMGSASVKKQLGNDKLTFKLSDTGDSAFDNAYGTIDSNTDSDALAKAILKLPAAQVNKVFGIETTQGTIGSGSTPSTAATTSAYVDGAFILTEPTVGSKAGASQKFVIGQGANSSKTYFKIDRSILESLELFGSISSSLTDILTFTPTAGKTIAEQDIELSEAIKDHVISEWTTWKASHGATSAALISIDKAKIVIKNIRSWDKKTFLVDVYYKVGSNEVPISIDTPISTK